MTKYGALYWEMDAFISPIDKQVSLLSFNYLYFWHFINAAAFHFA